MEKCYRDIQARGQIAGLSIIEVFILLGIPLLLFPLFTLLGWPTLFIMGLEAALYFIFRLADRASHFGYGLFSLLYFTFVWPRQLSGYPLDEPRYLIINEKKKDNG